MLLVRIMTDDERVCALVNISRSDHVLSEGNPCPVVDQKGGIEETTSWGRFLCCAIMKLSGPLEASMLSSPA